MNTFFKNRTSLMTRKKQAGLTLMELVVSLAIVGAVVGGVLSLYTSTSNSQKSTQLITDTQALRAAIRQIGSAQGSYAGLTNTIVSNSGKTPATITIDTTATPHGMTHGFNGDVEITPIASNTQFQVRLLEIPAAACADIVTASANWGTLAVGTGATTTAVADASNFVTVQTACGSSGVRTIDLRSN